MFEMKRCVTYSQVKSDLKIDMAMIVDYFQDCTLAHSESIGKGLQNLEITRKAWFLSSWQIEVERYPQYSEDITVRTWPYAFKGLYGYRNFDILDANGEQIVKAGSIWVFMDLEKGRPTRPTEEDVRGYDLEPALEMEYAPRKIAVFDDAYAVGKKENILVRSSFLDSNEHVNNGRYVAEALDLLEGNATIERMRVDYRKAAVLGDIFYPVLYEQDNVKQVTLSDGAGNPYVVVEVS